MPGNATTHAFISAPDGGTLRDLGTLGGTSSSGRAVNASGQVAGESLISGNTANHAFISAPDGGALRDLGTLGGTNSSGLAINASGQVVGYSAILGNTANHAFIYTGKGGLVDLNSLGLSTTLVTAYDINEYGQITGLTSTSAYLLTLHPTWSGTGSGSWDSSANWNFAGLGELVGLTPGLPHDVVIAPTNSLTVTGPSGVETIRSLVLGGGSGKAALDLGGGTLNATNGVSVATNGVLKGTGTVNANIANAADGELRVGAGQSMMLSGTSHANAGKIEVIGGELEVSGALTNEASTGIITGRDAALRFDSGLTNNGSLSLTAGISDISGDITNASGAKIINSGGGTVTFYDDLINNGEVRTSTGGTSVFFGSVQGSGAFTGLGDRYFEGDLRPGNSPGLLTFVGGRTTFGDNSVSVFELAGTARGIELGYDAIDILNDGSLTLNGTLDIRLGDSFMPTSGNIFDLIIGDDINGVFDHILFPALAGGVTWKLVLLQDFEGSTTDYLRLTAAPAVPLPGAVWLFGSALVGLVALSRRSGRSEGISA
jgi:probable HAF family extracellular repeat protein